MLSTPAGEWLNSSQMGLWYGGARPRSGTMSATLSEKPGPAPRGAAQLKEAEVGC